MLAHACGRHKIQMFFCLWQWRSSREQLLAWTKIAYVGARKEKRNGAHEMHKAKYHQHIEFLQNRFRQFYHLWFFKPKIISSISVHFIMIPQLGKNSTWQVNTNLKFKVMQIFSRIQTIVIMDSKWIRLGQWKNLMLLSNQISVKLDVWLVEDSRIAPAS